MVHVGFITG